MAPPGQKPQAALRQQVIPMNTNSKTKNPANVVPEHVGHASLGQRDDSSVARAAMTHIYQETTPDGQDPVGFGKAASMTYQGIAADQQYCNWVKTQQQKGVAQSSCRAWRSGWSLKRVSLLAPWMSR